MSASSKSVPATAVYSYRDGDSKFDPDRKPGTVVQLKVDTLKRKREDEHDQDDKPEEKTNGVVDLTDSSIPGPPKKKRKTSNGDEAAEIKDFDGREELPTDKDELDVMIEEAEAKKSKKSKNLHKGCKFIQAEADVGHGSDEDDAEEDEEGVELDEHGYEKNPDGEEEEEEEDEDERPRKRRVKRISTSDEEADENDVKEALGVSQIDLSVARTSAQLEEAMKKAKSDKTQTEEALRLTAAREAIAFSELEFAEYKLKVARKAVVDAKEKIKLDKEELAKSVASQNKQKKAYIQHSKLILLIENKMSEISEEEKKEKEQKEKKDEKSAPVSPDKRSRVNPKHSSAPASAPPVQDKNQKSIDSFLEPGYKDLSVVSDNDVAKFVEKIVSDFSTEFAESDSFVKTVATDVKIVSQKRHVVKDDWKLVYTYAGAIVRVHGSTHRRGTSEQKLRFLSVQTGMKSSEDRRAQFSSYKADLNFTELENSDKVPIAEVFAFLYALQHESTGDASKAGVYPSKS